MGEDLTLEEHLTLGEDLTEVPMQRPAALITCRMLIPAQETEKCKLTTQKPHLVKAVHKVFQNWGKKMATQTEEVKMKKELRTPYSQDTDYTEQQNSTEACTREASQGQRKPTGKQQSIPEKS